MPLAAATSTTSGPHDNADKSSKVGGPGDGRAPPAPGSLGAGSADKYQTLPFNTKFGQGTTASAQVNKIEALKAEKENNNVGFASDLPPPPPIPVAATIAGQQPRFPDYQGNFSSTTMTSTTTTTSTPASAATTTPTASVGGSFLPKVPPKPSSAVPDNSGSSVERSVSPPPYKPAPPPTSTTAVAAAATNSANDTSEASSAITILRGKEIMLCITRSVRALRALPLDLEGFL